MYSFGDQPYNDMTGTQVTFRDVVSIDQASAGKQNKTVQENGWYGVLFTRDKSTTDAILVVRDMFKGGLELQLKAFIDLEKAFAEV